MFATVVDALVSPGTFFAERDDLALRWPAVVVVASAVVTSAFVLLLVAQLRHLADPDRFRVALAAIPPLLVAVGLVSQLLVTEVLYAASYPVSGRGGGRTLLAYLGWLPQFVGTLVLAVAAAVAVSQLLPPTDEATARQFAMQLDEGPLMALAAVAGTARATANGVVHAGSDRRGGRHRPVEPVRLVAAVRQSRGLTRRQALLAVAIPVGFLLIN